MKVKNIMFSGIMAAILGATAAHADPVQLISKNYADNNLQAKLNQTDNAGDNIAISADGKISATGLVKTDTYTATVGALEAKDAELAGEIAKKLDTETYTAKIAEIEGVLDGNAEGSVKKQIADAIASEVVRADAKYATEADLTTAEGRIGALEQTATTLATKDEVNAKVAQSDYNTKMQALDNKDAELAEDITDITKDGGVIDDKIDALNLANTYDAKGAAASAESAAKTYADGLKTTIDAAYAAADATTLQSAKDYAGGLNTAMDARVVALETIDHDKFAEKTTVAAINGRLTAAEGEIDALQTATANLDDFIDSTEIQAYATAEALAGVKTTAEKGVSDAATAQSAAEAAQSAADAAQADVDAIEGNSLLQKQAQGRYIIDFDANGNASYQEIEII